MSLRGPSLSEADLPCMFSPAADEFLEEMAARSVEITRARFGNTIQMYSPLYISNECTNSCLYCGFNHRNKILRKTLNMDEIEAEAGAIYRRGFRHILVLTGEHPGKVPVTMLAGALKRIHRKFSSVSIEVYPMDTDDYRLMTESGVDGLTVYQETYNRDMYSQVHPAGKKRDFNYRLETPDRGGIAGIRKIGVGALLGLTDWRVEGFFTALHAFYLSKKYWRSQVSVSFPRMRQASGGFQPKVDVTDRDLTHLICAMRIILPDAGLALSTREPAELRDNLFPLGITMMSAGSHTEPGGYTGMKVADEQFRISDGRSPDEMARVIKDRGFDPVWKDWGQGHSVCIGSISPVLPVPSYTFFSPVVLLCHFQVKPEKIGLLRCEGPGLVKNGLLCIADAVTPGFVIEGDRAGEIEGLQAFHDFCFYPF